MRQSFLPLALAAGLVLVLACNNASEKKETIDSTTVNKDTAATRPMATYSVRPVFLEPDDIIDLLDADNNNNTPRMIYFEFDFGQGGNDVVVRAHARDSAGNKLPDVDIPLSPDNMGTPVTFQYSEQYPYNNIIVRGHLKQFLGYSTYANRPIRANEFKKTILMTPCINSSGKVMFIITNAEDAKPTCDKIGVNQTGKILTNPSPPGTPACMSACDDPGFTFMSK